MLAENTGSQLQLSSIYRSLPYAMQGVENQLSLNYFFNCVLRLSSQLEPLAMLKLTTLIETKIGKPKAAYTRKGAKIWQDRALDIDILLADDKIFNTPDLIIPHHDMANRAFVLKPLLEIAPDLMHPQDGKSFFHHWQRLPQSEAANVVKVQEPFKLSIEK